MRKIKKAPLAGEARGGYFRTDRVDGSSPAEKIMRRLVREGRADIAYGR